MTCNRLGFELRLVHKPVGKRVTQVVKLKPLTVFDLHSGRFRSQPEMGFTRKRMKVI
jgi:hypothetical protein